MALIRCPECGKEVSDRAPACIHCGCPLTPSVPAVQTAPAQPDRSAELENLRTLAKRAQEANDSAQAAKYYEQILMLDPDDWKATFYVPYYNAHNVKIYQLGEAANRVANCFDPVLRLVKTKVPEGPLQTAALLEISLRVMAFKKC